MRQVQGHGHRGRGQGRADHRSAGLHHRDRARQGLRGPSARGLPQRQQIDKQPGDWNREKSQQVMEAFLVKYDDIDGVYSGDDNMGVGALNAAKAAGRDGIIFVGAPPTSPSATKPWRTGDYWGSIYQSPVDDAEAALQTAIDVLNGEDVPVPELLRHAEDHSGQHGRVRQAGLLISSRAGAGRGPPPRPDTPFHHTQDIWGGAPWAVSRAVPAS